MKVGTDMGTDAKTHVISRSQFRALYNKIKVVPEVGLEPTSLAAADFESSGNLGITGACADTVPRTDSEQPVNVGTEFVTTGDRPGYVYRYWSDRGTLLYIGVSINAVARMGQHRKQEWFPRIARIDVQRFDTYDEAERAELKAICYEGPIHNVRGPRDAKDVGPAISRLKAAQRRRRARELLADSGW